MEGDESDESDEWDLEESDEEDKWWEGPGDTMYRDYRRMQRSTFLVSKLREREEMVKKEMARWVGLMEKLQESLKKGGEDGPEEFALDCHDLSLENVFVDQTDHTRVVRHLLSSILSLFTRLHYCRHVSLTGNRQLHAPFGPPHISQLFFRAAPSSVSFSAKLFLISRPTIRAILHYPSRTL